MESNNKWKETDNRNLKCYYFVDIIKVEDFEFNKILTNQKPYENILVYGISCKTFIGAKPLSIRINKVDGFNRACYGIRYLALLEPEKYDAIFNRIRYLIGAKGSITYAISYKYEKIML